MLVALFALLPDLIGAGVPARRVKNIAAAASGDARGAVTDLERLEVRPAGPVVLTEMRPRPNLSAPHKDITALGRLTSPRPGPDRAPRVPGAPSVDITKGAKKAPPYTRAPPPCTGRPPRARLPAAAAIKSRSVTPRVRARPEPATKTRYPGVPRPVGRALTRPPGPGLASRRPSPTHCAKAPRRSACPCLRRRVALALGYSCVEAPRTAISDPLYDSNYYTFIVRTQTRSPARCARCCFRGY